MKSSVAAVMFLLSALGGCLLNEDPYPAPVDDLSVRQITMGTHPSVSPNGKKLAFSRSGALFMCDTNGLNAVQLTNGSFNDIMPQWSPDGKAIGFIRQGYGAYGTLMSVDILQKSLLTFTPENAVLCRTGKKRSPHFNFDDGESVSMPVWSWSPSGALAAFYTGPDTMIMLSVISTDGSKTTAGSYPVFHAQMWNPLENSSGFCWLPPQDRLVCTSNVVNDTSCLYLITPGVPSMVRLTNKNYVAYPTCSADGRYIGFLAQSATYNYHILDQQTGFINSLYAGQYSPRLSPDGKKVVYYYYYYNSNPDGYSSSYLSSTDIGTGLGGMVALSGWDYSFVFHPSSGWIYLSRGGIIRKAPVP